MPDFTKKEITIMGGGIAGLGIAVALQKKGIPYQIFESAKTLSPVGAGIGLSFNAVRACEKLGILNDIKLAGNPIEVARITDATGKIISELNMRKHVSIFKELSLILERHQLHEALLSKVPGHLIHLNKKSKSFNYTDSGKRMEVLFEDGTQINPEYIIASDGIHSLFRKTFIPSALPRYSGYTCWRGIAVQPETYPYKHITIESWGRGRRLGMVPLANNKIYWYAVINAVQKNSSLKSLKKNEIIKLFPSWDQHFLDVLQATDQKNIIWNDISDIDPLKQFAFGNAVLVGDAAHAATPDLGQGGGMALEDAVVIAECLVNSNNYADAFRKFENTRLERTKKVVLSSRSLAALGQLENTFLIKARNMLLRLMPEEWAVRQISWLADTPF